jgi:hypothetical protein
MDTPSLSDVSPVRQGMATGSNTRYVRNHWEVLLLKIFVSKVLEFGLFKGDHKWSPYVKGAENKKWIEPLSAVVDWQLLGCSYAYSPSARYGRGAGYYFKPGLSYSTIGSNFSARKRRFKSIFDVSGASVFPAKVEDLVCLMNSHVGKEILTALNPTINFQVGDVNRLPLFPIDSADEIFVQLDRAFTEHEAARETSVEFKQPGSSCWDYAQDWAQQAVDRPSGTPLPDWNPVYKESSATNWVSYAFGSAIGRFGANGEGILTDTPENALPHGILYLSAYSGDQPDSKDSLNHIASAPLLIAWHKHSNQIPKSKSLHDWLRLNFFKEVHIGMYEQRPIYFPLSSAKKNFVAYLSIHRWSDATLPTLLAEYLFPELRQLEGEVNDLMEARTQGDRKQQSQAEERRAKVQQLHAELKTFIDLVQQCAEQGPPPAKDSDTPRETNTPFHIDLDDGVMINSAALWPLLEPQWAKPKTWWSELCNAQGKKDYDWSHLAARYFPQRVDDKCQSDPSLAVAHGCFWKYHPAKAYEWELRLQDEIGSDFTLNEPNSDTYRTDFESNHPEQVTNLREKEAKRRERKYGKENDDDDESTDYGPLFEIPKTDSITDALSPS